MWTTVERTIDGAVGRVLSWWVQPAIRPVIKDTAAWIPTEPGKAGTGGKAGLGEMEASEADTGMTGAAKTDAGKTTATAAERARETRQTAEKDGVEKNAAESAATAVEKTVQGKAEAAFSVDDSILEALDAAPEGLAMKELIARTGAKRHALRRSLNRLMADGRVLRKGEGMRTCYHVRST